jgi:hypothetical protein
LFERAFLSPPKHSLEADSVSIQPALAVRYQAAARKEAARAELIRKAEAAASSTPSNAGQKKSSG